VSATIGFWCREREKREKRLRVCLNVGSLQRYGCSVYGINLDCSEEETPNGWAAITHTAITQQMSHLEAGSLAGPVLFIGAQVARPAAVCS
jgi:hypothetical protein